LGLRAGEDIAIGVRPERLNIDANGSAEVAFDARIRLIEHLGRETILHVDADPVVTTGSDTGTRNVTVQLGDVVAFANGETVRIGFDLNDTYLFGPDGKTLTPPKSATRT
jgi:multiple sugar transport system ATP-binding protein